MSGGLGNCWPMSLWLLSRKICHLRQKKKVLSKVVFSPLTITCIETINNKCINNCKSILQL